MLLAESDDSGHSWSAFREVPMPEVVGPPSLTNPLIILPDGTLVMSIESNKTYEDDSTWYQRVVMLHSRDQGQTWGEPAVAGFDPSGRIYNWDQRVGLAPDGRLGAFLWIYDSKTSTYHNLHRRISADVVTPGRRQKISASRTRPPIPPFFPMAESCSPTWTASTPIRSAPDWRPIGAAFDPDSEVVIYQHAAIRKMARRGQMAPLVCLCGPSVFLLVTCCPMVMSSSSTTPAVKRPWMFTGRACASRTDASIDSLANRP